VCQRPNASRTQSLAARLRTVRAGSAVKTLHVRPLRSDLGRRVRPTISAGTPALIRQRATAVRLPCVRPLQLTFDFAEAVPAHAA
jgi:hypothetical protein